MSIVQIPNNRTDRMESVNYDNKIKNKDIKVLAEEIQSTDFIKLGGKDLLDIKRPSLNWEFIKENIELVSSHDLLLSKEDVLTVIDNFIVEYNKGNIDKDNILSKMILNFISTHKLEDENSSLSKESLMEFNDLLLNLDLLVDGEYINLEDKESIDKYFKYISRFNNSNFKSGFKGENIEKKEILKDIKELLKTLDSFGATTIDPDVKGNDLDYRYDYDVESIKDNLEDTFNKEKMELIIEDKNISKENERSNQRLYREVKKDTREIVKLILKDENIDSISDKRVELISKRVIDLIEYISNEDPNIKLELKKVIEEEYSLKNSKSSTEYKVYNQVLRSLFYSDKGVNSYYFVNNRLIPILFIIIGLSIIKIYIF